VEIKETNDFCFSLLDVHQKKEWDNPRFHMLRNCALSVMIIDGWEQLKPIPQSCIFPDNIILKNDGEDTYSRFGLSVQ